MLNPSRHQVLIVEGDAAVRNTLALLLKASGYEVSTAANGAEALALLQMGTPAILLSDLNMPEMSGFELLAVARRLHGLAYPMAARPGSPPGPISPPRATAAPSPTKETP